MAILHRFLIKFLRAFNLKFSKQFQNISFENCFCILYLGKESHRFANHPPALKKASAIQKYLPSIKLL